MGYISKDFIDKLLDRAHIDEVIGKFVDLKKAGANLSAKSPFSQDKTASLMVSVAKNMWKDFSSGKGGNIVTFVMEVKPCSYPEAIEIIAGIYNEPVEYVKDEWSEKRVEILAKKEVLRKVLNKVHELYFKKYQSLPIDHPAKIEVEGKRQYTPEIIADWGIGFAPDNYLYDLLKNSGKVSEGEALGVIKGQWDKYSNRIVYPIKDINGLLIGFGGRDISGKTNTAKWINPPVDSENLLYNKSKVWYGLDRAKFEIRKRGEVFITEGYNDVIAWHTNGLENTVASCGTAITEQQINEIKKLCTKAVFCMDPDEAGKKAVLKQLPEFIKAGFRTEVISLDADPDDYVRNHKSEITAAGGLEKIFKVPGTRKDGFAVLIEEFIKKDYFQLENELAHHRAILANEIVEFQDEKENLTYASGKIANDFIEAQNLLKEITLKHSKKSEEFTNQNAIVVDLKGKYEKSKNDIKNYAEPIQLKKQRKLVEELTTQYDLAYTNSDLKRSSGAKELCKIIINIQDDSHFEIYLSWIQKESKIAKAKLNAWIKELRAENLEVTTDDDTIPLEYELPKDVTIPFKQLEQDINLFGLFMANNKIYFSHRNERKVYFTPLSNFEIEIIQHMALDKFPSLLVRMKNVLNNEVIFDCPTESFNSLMRFKDVLSKHRNYIFTGKNEDLEKLYIYLSSKMGMGVKLETMGWQIDGRFWAWNNKVIVVDVEEKDKDQFISENGQYIKDDVHYYIPSANKIFEKNKYKYNSEKSFKEIKNPASLYEILSLTAKVHRHHYISPFLYAISTLFRDVVTDTLDHYPILFLYGKGGTGKDELAEIILSFFGKPQKPINLESELSTAKATMRVLAQFINGMIMFSEYKRGNQKQDGALKSVYDLTGYSIGTIESKFSTDYIPVETGLLLTGNEFPDHDPLLQRLIWNQMDKNQFTQEEQENMKKLKKLVKDGMSGFASDFIKYRNLVEEKFSDEHGKWMAILTPIFPEAKIRMIDNLSIISAFYGIFSDIFKFPFTQFEMIDHFKIGIQQQMYRINSSSLMVKFWDCFISSFRGPTEDRIQAKKMVNIEDTSLYMQWTNVYMKIQKQWYVLYRDSAPKKEVMMEEIIKIPGLFVQNHKVYSFDTGKQAVRSSAIELNIMQIDSEIKNNILGAFMEQVYSETLFSQEVENLKALYDEDEKKSGSEQKAELLDLNENGDWFDED